MNWICPLCSTIVKIILNENALTSWSVPPMPSIWLSSVVMTLSLTPPPSFPAVNERLPTTESISSMKRIDGAPDRASSNIYTNDVAHLFIARQISTLTTSHIDLQLVKYHTSQKIIHLFIACKEYARSLSRISTPMTSHIYL